MYCYQTEREKLFTEEGQNILLKIRDNVKRLIEEAGAVRFIEGTNGCCGDSWTMLACFDRMVEIGDIREITGSNVAGQHRVFVSNKD